MFTIKRNNLIGINQKSKWVLLSVGILVIAYGILNQAPTGYLTFEGSDIGNSYFYDYLAPFLFSASFLFSIQSYNQRGIIHTLFFLSNRKTLSTIIYLAVKYTGISSSFLVIGAAFFYQNTGNLIEVFYLSLSFIPNLLFLNGLLLCMNAVLKNAIQSMIFLSAYLLLDYFMGARVFGPFSIGVHAYQTQWSNNRLLLSLASLVLFSIGTRAKTWLYTEKFRAS